MKKFILATFSVALFFTGILAVWSVLMPEIPPDESVIKRLSDSSENQKYFSSVADEYRRQVNKKASALLASIHTARQVQLFNIAEAISRHGAGSEEVKQSLDMKARSDEEHLRMISELLDKHGWLGAERIGALNTFTLFSVIQDSDFATQEKYTGLMERAVREGTLSPTDFARFVDRRALVQHSRQIYGSLLRGDLAQGKFSFAPIADAEHVNERRLAIGLPGIETYAAEHHVDVSDLKKAGE